MTETARQNPTVTTAAEPTHPVRTAILITTVVTLGAVFAALVLSAFLTMFRFEFPAAAIWGPGAVSAIPSIILLVRRNRWSWISPVAAIVVEIIVTVVITATTMPGCG